MGLLSLPGEQIFGFAKDIVDRIWPDPTQRAQAALELEKLKQSGELQVMATEAGLLQGQIEVNKIEAASTNLFVSGWRPAVGWVCCLAFAWSYFLGPLLFWLFAVFGNHVPLPTLDLSQMVAVLIGMLGLGAYRTVEKVKGVAGGCPTPGGS